MSDLYKNGPEDMPRVKRMSNSTIDWIINGVNTDGMLAAGELPHQQLRNVCHAVAEEVLARISWPAREGAISWTRVEDRRPTDYKAAYLVASNWGVRMAYLHNPEWGDGFQDVATKSDEGMFNPDEQGAFKVTHWMLLPPPPGAPTRIQLGTFTVVRDDSLPAGVAELRDEEGKTMGRITNIDRPASVDYMLEFRSAGTDTWYPSPHPRRPKSEAELYAKEANARDRSIVYRAVPWDGK